MHESHKLTPIVVDGFRHSKCEVCGGIATAILKDPCRGPVPELKVTVYDEDVATIQWSFPDGGIKRSTFPHPLVTIDHALDGRPIALTIVGKSNINRLREALDGNN